jgi:hypothetical protein
LTTARRLPFAFVIGGYLFTAGVWSAKLELAEIRTAIAVLNTKVEALEKSFERGKPTGGAQAARYVH